MTITGDIVPGVEPGCLLITSGSESYLLIGGDPSALVAGHKVTVVGTPEPGGITTCQQGTPFRVRTVAPA